MADDPIRILWHLDDSKPYDAQIRARPSGVIVRTAGSFEGNIIESYFLTDEDVMGSGISAGELFDAERRQALLAHLEELGDEYRVQVDSIDRSLTYRFPPSAVKDISATRWQGQPPVKPPNR